ncbi:hypothetical protein PM10SUCC1_21630 [Propionigenium maris DSM 9537]|uniref:PAS domain S-box-containing protein n=2 Tax=Propionigenium TaxID=2332 RepID=A0A9W6GK64_9FUSO|nr:hypothetical protein PM10SUCC1_21630 [Propionigenium maris DSM 9537]
MINMKNLSQYFHGYLSKGAEIFDLKHTISTTMTLFYSNRKMKNELSCLQLAERISNFGYWTLNLPEGTVYLSEGTRKICGFSEDRYPLKYLHSFPLPKYRDMLDTSLKDLIQGKLPYDVEFKIKNKITGRIIPIHSVALYDPIGNTITGTLYDISKQKNPRREL